MADQMSDYWRQLLRNTRKKLGFPASGDVGTLSNMIRALRDQASNLIGEPTSAASISIPYLSALYGEDIHDAFEYLSLVYLDFEFGYMFRPMYATRAAYAGHGRGLCRDYTDAITCEKEEQHILSRFMLSISYTRTSLLTSQARIATAHYVGEEMVRQNLRLSYDTKHGESYWEEVRDMLQSPVLDNSIQRNNSMILVYGDAAEIPRFKEVLREVIHDVVGGEPEILDQQPEFSAAQGAAELAKRAIFSRRHTNDLVVDSEL
jgi:hypothetical protein